MMMTPDVLQDAVAGFVAECQQKINHHYVTTLPNLTPPTLSVKENPRYWRIVCTESHGGSRVYCFIDPASGDVLKADSFKKPAKGARGNLFDESKGLGRMTVYGAGYNR